MVIQELRQKFPLHMLLDIAQIPRATFYYHAKRMVREDKYAIIKTKITELFQEHQGRYGYRRITDELHNQNFAINHKTVQRLMKELGLVCRVRMKKYRSYKGEVGKVADNLLDRDFHAEKPNQKWTTDGKRYTTYACPKHKGGGCPTKEIRTEYVDGMATRLIYQDLIHRGDHAEITRLMKCSSDTKKLLDKRRGVERAIAGVMKAIETSYSETLPKRLDQLEAEKASLDRAIAKSKLDNPGITEENKKQLSKKLARYLRKTDDPDAKKYLVETIKEIRVTNTDVIIEMKIA